MTSEAITRRLVAIVSADVAGYSRLMTLDGEDTVRRLKEFRQLIGDLADSHEGRVVDNPGDNALLEFPTATGAVECSLAIQAEVGERNADVLADRRMEFRIGVHLGEVMYEDGRIYGDGVNVAARIEALAEPGGICVSRTVRDQLGSSSNLTFGDLGEQQLKNIRQPVQVFRVANSQSEAVYLSARVEGFEQMIEEDRSGALAALQAHRTATDPIVLSHGGTAVEESLAGMMYEFPSAMHALNASIAAQSVMAERDLTVAEPRRMNYLLGLAKSPDGAIDVRTQSPPGGFAVSDDVYQSVAGDLDVDLMRLATDHGHRSWTMKRPTLKSVDPQLGPGAVVVLPFERIGNDESQDYLVDGISEDVTSALAEYGELRVIPRTSAYSYRDSTLSDRDIARRLDATYVLKGSVRATKDRVRVSTELVEAESGTLVWTERFDRIYEDVLDLQDEIAHNIASKLTVAARGEEVRRSLTRGDSTESWDLLQRGKWHYYRASKEDFDTAIKLYEEAIELDPDSSEAYPWLCLVLITRVWHGWSPDVAGDFERIHTLASKAIRINPTDWRAHNALSVYYMFQTRDFDRAIEEAKYGERFEPGTLGAVYQRAGDHERSIELSMRDLQINPNRPDRYHWTTNLAQSHYMLGNYPAALAWAEQSLELDDGYIQALGFKAASLAQLGRADEVSVVMDQFMTHFKGMTAARYKTRFNFKKQSDIDHYMEGLIKAGLPAGDEPTSQRAVWIAVLPFENIGNDPDQEYFADGIAEDVITGLSAYHSLRVIARSSSFQFRDSDLSLPEIAEHLDVQYLLEGSVRKAGDRVRVTAQLIEAPDDHHIWADRYDEVLDDIFEAQDRITSSIVAAIDPAIRAEHVSSAPPQDLEAWDHVQRGWHAVNQTKPDSLSVALQHFRMAIELDPAYAEAHAHAGWAMATGVWLLWRDDPEADLRQAERYAKRAIELDERDALGHQALAMVAYAQGRMDLTVKEGERAIQLNPSSALAYMLAGAGHAHGGDPATGIPMLTKAMELSPQDPFNTWFLGGRAIGHLLAGSYEDAIVDARAAIGTRYGYLMGRVILITALVQLGREHEAKVEMKTLLEIDPEFSLDYLTRYTLTGEERHMFDTSLVTAGWQG